jgi:hypothetical protein
MAPPPQEPDGKRHRSGEQRSYNQNGSVQVLGYSRLTDPEMKDLAEAEKQEIRDPPRSQVQPPAGPSPAPEPQR